MGAGKTLFGCAGQRGPLETYGKRFDVLELDVLDRTPPTKDATLRKWRKDAGPRLGFSLIAPAALAAVRPTPALDEALARLLEAQRLLQARWIVLATPVEVTPAPLPRERLAAVVGRIREGLGEAREVVRVVWQPRGVWELETAASFAKTIPVDLCADPLGDPREPFWDDGLRYLRLSAVGGRTVFPPMRMRAVAELLAAAQGDDARAGITVDRVVVLTTPRAPAEVRKLRQLVQSLSTRGAGDVGGGRVILPRNRVASGEEE